MNVGGFQNWEHLLVLWLGRTPLLLVLGMVGVICLCRLSNRPREHWLLGLAVALLLFGQVGLPNITSFVLSQVGSGVVGAGENSRLLVQFAIGLPLSVISAVSWGLLLYVAFGIDGGRRPRYLDEEEPPSAK